MADGWLIVESREQKSAFIGAHPWLKNPMSFSAPLRWVKVVSDHETARAE